MNFPRSFPYYSLHDTKKRNISTPSRRINDTEPIEPMKNLSRWDELEKRKNYMKGKVRRFRDRAIPEVRD